MCLKNPLGSMQTLAPFPRASHVSLPSVHPLLFVLCCVEVRITIWLSVVYVVFFPCVTSFCLDLLLSHSKYYQTTNVTFSAFPPKPMTMPQNSTPKVQPSLPNPCTSNGSLSSGTSFHQFQVFPLPKLLQQL